MPMRKLSLSRKSSSASIPNLDGMQKGTPPRARSASEAPGTPESSDKGKHKSVKKRLSSLFSSHSLSATANDTAHTTHKPSKLGANGSSTSSGTSSPSVPPSDAVTRDMSSLRLGTVAVPLVDSPEASPVNGTPSKPERAPSVTASLYSQWDEVEDDDDDDDAAFLTPSEGLSEVEEEDEEEEHAAAPAATAAAAAAGSVGGVEKPTLNGTTRSASENPAASPTEPAKPKTAKVRRSHAADATKVTRREYAQRGDPAKVDQAAALAPDLDVTRQALALFLSSRMKESERLLEEKDPENTHMYLMSASGVIQSLKGLMTFDSGDIHAALDICRLTAVTASGLRRPTDSIVSKLGGLVRSGQALARVKAMTPLERHAELVYSETVLMKALLGIVGGGDWMGMIREALNMRSAHGTYRVLQQYLDDADKDGYDDDIDMDFRSGVLLGTGTSALMLSLLPGKVVKVSGGFASYLGLTKQVASILGFGGDRDTALSTLMAAGGWSADSQGPAFDETQEGLRRPICDMILLAYHLVVSVLMPVAGVDIDMARKILAYSMKRYPDGIFFLYFQARLHTTQCEPELANQSLQKALDLDLEYVQLQHMCLWDYGCNYLMLCDWDGAQQCFAILKDESNWSRAVYTYVTAACWMELINDDAPEVDSNSKPLVDKYVKELPKLTKKIAGKSLPIEKFCSRKARKFTSQGDWLFLPAMELAYVFGALGHTPRRVLIGTTLPRLNAALANLEASTPEKWGNGHQYWDDFALGHFLRGVIQAVACYQPPEASAEARKAQPGEPSDAELDQAAERDLKLVLKHGVDVVLDHYIIYHCHYELGRLYARRGDKANAKTNFEVVLSGKLLEVNPHQSKAHGKYSLEGALLIKAHAALTALKEGA